MDTLNMSSHCTRNVIPTIFPDLKSYLLSTVLNVKHSSLKNRSPCCNHTYILFVLLLWERAQLPFPSGPLHLLKPLLQILT